MNTIFINLYRAVGLLGLVAALAGLVQPAHAQQYTDEVKFRIRVENISATDAIKAPGGGRQGVGISPGAWAIHTAGSPIFTAGTYDRGKGLESQSEDGNPTTLAATLSSDPAIKTSGVFNIPVGKTEPGPLRGGNAYEFTISAKPGDRLSMTMMFGHSNDWFFSPGDTGIPLFSKNGKALSGDITRFFTLWDAGTEQDEEPGIGKYQAAAQSKPNDGPDEHVVIQPVADRRFPFRVPPVNRTIRVTITPEL